MNPCRLSLIPKHWIRTELVHKLNQEYFFSTQYKWTCKTPCKKFADRSWRTHYFDFVWKLIKSASKKSHENSCFFIYLLEILVDCHAFVLKRTVIVSRLSLNLVYHLIWTRDRAMIIRQIIYYWEPNNIAS